ncbi:MAG TPA: hypothetical protein VFD41_00325 [Actinomycetales bacterium]|nr:hypothetical protein [Actinomycetales bacterium]
MSDLVAAALGKAGLVWVSVGQGRPQAVWHVWHDGAALVVVGGDEQPDPVGDATRVTVAVPSKDNGARLVTFGSSVDQVGPDDERWDACVAALGPNRLNTSTSVDQGAVWAEGSRLLRLVPDETLEEHPGSYDDSSGAAPVLSSPATTTTWHPFHLRGRRRKRFRL